MATSGTGTKRESEISSDRKRANPYLNLSSVEWRKKRFVSYFYLTIWKLDWI